MPLPTTDDSSEQKPAVHPARSLSFLNGWMLMLLCALLMLGLWLAQLTPYLNVADDSGRYMVLGEALARTSDLRLLNAPTRPLDTLYPPGFPAIIAFWLLVTRREPGEIVLQVKATQLLLLIGTLPMLYSLLLRARLSRPYVVGTMLLYALCPATIGYANEVMSEMPLLFLCLASVGCVERRAILPGDSAEEEALPPAWRRGLALACAVGAFLMRTSGIALLIAQTVWFWRRFGWRWGAAAGLILLLVVGGWLGRSRHIIKTHPKIRYATYIDQFTLRDPARLNAGRIPLNPLGLLSRMKSGFPTYIGLIPRAALYMMAPPRSWQLALFYLVAVPLTLLIFIGLVLAWKRGLVLSAGFSVLFWFVAAMWPWQNARFLVPLVPLMFVFAAMGAEYVWGLLLARPAFGWVRPLGWLAVCLLLAYDANVHYRIISQERKPAPAGYPLGRNRPEGGFYAACRWLKQHAEPGAVVMGKPPYLLHLYSGCTTTQIEPTANPRVQEKAYIVPQQVRYLLEDAWPFGFSTHKLLVPYLRVYGDRWTLAWQDPLGSGVRIWRRNVDSSMDSTAGLH